MGEGTLSLCTPGRRCAEGEVAGEPTAAAVYMHRLMENPMGAVRAGSEQYWMGWRLDPRGERRGAEEVRARDARA